MANETAVTEKEILGTPYVRSATAPLRDVVVVMPGAALGQIVPLYGESSPIVSRAKEAHAILVRTLHQNGVRIHPLEENDETGLASFVADCAMLAINLPPRAIVEELLIRPA